MANNNKPIITSPANTIAVIPASAYASISTLTYITISNAAFFAATLPTPKPILTPLKKRSNKHT